MKTLQPHEQRVLEERNELLAEVEKLVEFVKSPKFSTLSKRDQDLLTEQGTHMAQYCSVLPTRLYGMQGFGFYKANNKSVAATEMTREEYCKLRSWTVPQDEDPYCAGFLIEFSGQGNPNHIDFKNYITWMTKDVFEMLYSPMKDSYG